MVKDGLILCINVQAVNPWLTRVPILSCTTVTPLTLRIRELRERRGWSQAELGRRAGVAASVVNRIERRGTIALRTLEKIAGALNVSARSLIGRS